MRKFIRQLRTQPEHVRKQILHISMLVFTTILVLLWVYSLDQTLGKKETQVSVKKDLEPFTVLKASVVDGYKNISSDSPDVVR